MKSIIRETWSGLKKSNKEGSWTSTIYRDTENYSVKLPDTTPGENYRINSLQIYPFGFLAVKKLII